MDINVMQVVAAIEKIAGGHDARPWPEKKQAIEEMCDEELLTEFLSWFDTDADDTDTDDTDADEGN